jgi:predicted site-specific integrase-resolvase
MTADRGVHPEVADDLVQDMTEIPTSMYACVCGKRAAKIRARRALAAAAATEELGVA